MSQGFGVDISDLGLTFKEQMFLKHYLTTGDANESVVKSRLVKDGADVAVVGTKTLEVLNTPRIRTAITRYNEATIGPYFDTFMLRAITLLDARAFFNIKDFFEDDGTLKLLKDIPEKALNALDGVAEDYKGKDADVRLVKADIASRIEALKLLHTMYKEYKADIAAAAALGSTGLSAEQQNELSAMFGKLSAQVAAQSGVWGYKQGLNDGKNQAPVDVTPPQEEVPLEMPSILALAESIPSEPPITPKQETPKEDPVPRQRGRMTLEQEGRRPSVRTADDI